MTPAIEKRIVIIGAGPTGLGAAYRLNELAYRNWILYEKNNYVGGLSASFNDKKSFTWDLGGHVLFSGNRRFNAIFEKLLNNEYLTHERKAFIRAFNRWIPYPFQNNLGYLPAKNMLECVLGLIKAKKASGAKNFKEWIMCTFGQGVAKYFMLPHNLKVWAHPLEIMDKGWISERVSIVNIDKILDNIINECDDVSWGPNNTFKFPLHGGTQDIFKRAAALVNGRINFNHELIGIDLKRKNLIFKNGVKEKFDILINTSPIGRLINSIYPWQEKLRHQANLLLHNSIYIVGVGLKGKCPQDKCWVYSPEDNTPFFRTTYFSNYSPHNTPEKGKYWSLMCEVTYSKYKPIERRKVINSVLIGLQKSGILAEKHLDNIVSLWLMQEDFAYPIPTLGRNRILSNLQHFLERNNIFSRGRFGGWKYEIGNMDHSFLQGLEVVDRILIGEEENVYKT